MTREELSSKKQKGDLRDCAKAMKVTLGCAIRTWERPGSKRYPALVATLERIITHRDDLANSINSDESKISE